MLPTPTMLYSISSAPAEPPAWQGEIVLPTQTERRQDKESVQFPADEVQEPLFTRVSFDAGPEVTPSATSPSPCPELAPTTQTGPGPDREAPTTGDNRRETSGASMSARRGIPRDSAAATQTGRRQNRKTPSALTDEVKAFIVRGLARYETPTRVAAAVKADFGVEIDRRRVFAYDPAGSRPPAQRWIDLHAATRAKFLQATAEIGVAHKVVRLRMLDRFANRAEEHNYTERAAKFLVQAALECGGFYERYRRPQAAATGRP